MKRQTIINKINSDFNGKAYCESKDECFYFDEENDGTIKKCAIGLFIPDNHSGESYIGGVACLLENYPDLAEFMPSNDIDLLNKFQNTHDELQDGTIEEQKNKLIDFVNIYWSE